MGIPPRAHTTTHRDPLPADEQFVLDEFLRLHPNWELTVWTDEMNDGLFRRCLGNDYAMVRDLPLGVMRADLARYLYLKEMGGWYFDTDYQPLKPFDDFCRFDLVLPVSWEGHDPTTDYPGIDKVGNAVMGSCQGHPFWDVVVAECLRRIRRWRIHSNTVEEITGPDMLTQVLATNRSAVTGLCMPPQPVFHPRISNCPVRAEQYPDSYGVHWCKGGWREDGPFQGAKRRLHNSRKKMAIRRWMKAKGIGLHTELQESPDVQS